MISSRTHIFTSESVTEGHPDKMADQISDTLLDAYLALDPNSKVALETVLKTGLCLIAGEVSSHAQISHEKLIRKKIEEIGYVSSELGFDAQNCSILLAIGDQSPDIAMGVDKSSEEIGAGDQGLMFGYACNETENFMPFPITYAHNLAKRLSFVRKEKILPFLGPDGKTQVSVRYENQVPVAIIKIIVSSQHLPNIPQARIKEGIIEEVIKKTVEHHLLDKHCEILINPTGNFVVGGPKGDTGLTGRKIIVDTYGGMGRHGGGAFSGKDPSKVDRSAAYMARYIAKNVVAAKLADRCEVQLAYAIGVSQPVSVMLNTFSTSKVSEEKIEHAIKELLDLSPIGIIRHLNLKRPIYQSTASYGHFGHNYEEHTWERMDLASMLKSKL